MPFRDPEKSRAYHAKYNRDHYYSPNNNEVVKRLKGRIRELEAELARPSERGARFDQEFERRVLEECERRIRETMLPRHNDNETFKDEQHQINRLRALWKSGRDKYASFFSALDEVRREVGDQALPMWCISKLQIGPEAIIKVTGVLNKTDESVIKTKLAAMKRKGQK